MNLLRARWTGPLFEHTAPVWTCSPCSNTQPLLFHVLLPQLGFCRARQGWKSREWFWSCRWWADARRENSAVSKVRWGVCGRADTLISSQGPCLVSKKQGGGDAGVHAVVMEGLVPGSLSAVPSEGCQLTGIGFPTWTSEVLVLTPLCSQRGRACLYGNAWDINDWGVLPSASNPKPLTAPQATVQKQHAGENTKRGFCLHYSSTTAAAGWLVIWQRNWQIAVGRWQVSH